MITESACFRSGPRAVVSLLTTMALVVGVFGVQAAAGVQPGTVTYKFSFDSTGFQFDFGNEAPVQIGSFSYDDSPVNFANGEGFYLVDFDLAPELSFDPGRDIGWVPEPDFDNTTIETRQGELSLFNDQWELFDSNGLLVFQIFARPDGAGGFIGEIVENGTGVSAPVSYTQIPVGPGGQPDFPPAGVLANNT